MFHPGRWPSAFLLCPSSARRLWTNGPNIRARRTRSPTSKAKACERAPESWTLAFLLLVFRLETRNHGGICQRGRVTQRAPLRDVAQQPTHDFPGARLRQIGRKENVIRFCDRADLFRHV